MRSVSLRSLGSVGSVLVAVLLAPLGCTTDTGGTPQPDLTGSVGGDLATADLRGSTEDLGGPPPSAVTFFISSRTGSAKLGGLIGADRICQQLATDAGFGDQRWAAYLSATAEGGQPAVNARDRIGSGPWYNYQKVKIADNVAALHSLTQMGLNKTTGLTERGAAIGGFGDTPNQHDILTGSNPDGTPATTCANWTSELDNDSAAVGHHDEMGGGMNLWNFAHASRGCSAAALLLSGGAGRIYCFATN